MRTVKLKEFGKDHWSLLGYIESRVHSYNIAPNTGELDKNHLRINPDGDYGVIATPFKGLFNRTWKDSYGSRLFGYWKDDKTTDPDKQINNHDDVNCLNDLEAAGLIEVLSLVNFYIKLTKKGIKMASELREWKNGGNHYSGFVPSKQKVKAIPEKV